VEFDYFCFQPNDPVNFPETTYFGSVVATVQPLFPLFASTGLNGGFGYVGGVIEVANPNPAAATVSLANVSHFSVPQTLSQDTVSIPAGSWAIFDGYARAAFMVNSNLPVRVVAMNFCGSVELPVCLATTTPYDDTMQAAPTITPASLAFAWQRGASTPPASRTISVSPANSAGSATATTVAGQSWLSVSNPLGASSNSDAFDAGGRWIGTRDAAPGRGRRSDRATRSAVPIRARRRVQVKMPASTQAGVHRVYLTVAVDGVPAAPPSYLNQVYQSSGMVWVN
jgi:hypothetical protein